MREAQDMDSKDLWEMESKAICLRTKEAAYRKGHI